MRTDDEKAAGGERLDPAGARAKALSMIDQGTQALDDEFSFETEFCWVFCFNSVRYVRTREPESGLFGNAPIIISKVDGALVPTGTAEPVERYVERYERGLRRRWWKFW